MLRGHKLAQNFSTVIHPKYNCATGFIWFGLVLWHINHCRLFNAKSYSYICIKYIWLCGGSRIPWLLLCKGGKPSHNAFPVNLCEMLNTPSLPSITSPLWTGVEATDRIQSMDQIEINCVLMLNCIVWRRTVLTLNLCTYA